MFIIGFVASSASALAQRFRVEGDLRRPQPTAHGRRRRTASIAGRIVADAFSQRQLRRRVGDGILLPSGAHPRQNGDERQSHSGHVRRDASAQRRRVASAQWIRPAVGPSRRRLPRLRSVAALRRHSHRHQGFRQQIPQRQSRR